MASRKSSFKLLLPVFLLLLTAYSTFLEAKLANSGVKGFRVACNEEERAALLKFRQGLKDPYGQLSSWVGEDCCNWTGIGCSNQTGNVLKLDLSQPFSCVEKPTVATGGYIWACLLGGELDPSLLSLTYLNYLDLSYNNFQGIAIPSFLGSLKKLRGLLPDSLGSLQYLKTLRISQNALFGPLPTIVGNLSHLHVLDLSFNMMNGTIPESIGQLAQLNSLDLWGSSWEGIISEIHFSNLSLLAYLSLSSTNNSLVFHFSHEWIPPFTLYTLSISDCKLMNPRFPTWLRNQSFLYKITLSTVGISDTIPDWFWGKSPYPYWWGNVDLSNNQLRGQLPKLVNFAEGASVNLNSNSLEGSLPFWPNVTELALASNRFSGPIPLNIGQEMPNMNILDLSRNNLNGSIPSSIRKIPQGFGSLDKLETLDLSVNHLRGPIPISMTSMTALNNLNLSNNNLSGPIPSTNQFHTFIDPTIYEGNSGLCGPPLPTPCSTSNNEDPQPKEDAVEDEDESGKIWFYVSTALGFIVGFWAVFGSLVIKRPWTYAYFQFLDKLKVRLLLVTTRN
ncbi:hypothetical protein ACLB2K_033766 [Fragaria x ananassa]